MSSLTIEMGMRRKRGNSPEIPRELAGRDDMTLAQKQRMAVMAKMGVGPIAPSMPAMRDMPSLVASEIASARGPPPTDRKAALLEQERRFREQQEKEEEAEELAMQEKLAKRGRRPGMARLGPVQPREDEIPSFLPAPMQVPAKKEMTMVVKISKETAERARQADMAKEVEEDDSESEAEDQVLAFLRMEKAKKNAKTVTPVVPPQKEQNPKPGKKKRKRTRGREGEGGEEWYAGDDDFGEEEGEGEFDPMLEARVQHADREGLVGDCIWRAQEARGGEPIPRLPATFSDGGVSKKMMVIDSVKGKVSTANRNFTDADLERRFSIQDSAGHGGLMSEEQVLKMIRKEKQDRGAAVDGSAARRVQRELAEWAAAKEQQRARVKSPHRFERMVVSRK